ncbi:MAG TPA: NAD(P)-binding domain-containing protein [Devosiaceae bacterium]|nr:NAD(P)-binding domain-containing protein [Devosiaceae bacterium]
MKIGVLGTGTVGETLATKLKALGHAVMMGSRSRRNDKAEAWAAEHGGGAGDFADAAAHGEIVFNCTKGEAALGALRQAGAEALADKVLVDVANPLAFEAGQLSLAIVNTDSLAETIQREFPAARVVKALNHMNASVMVDPARAPSRHTAFISGNDEAAKAAVTDLLKSFGWEDIIDLGDLSAARGMEMMLPLWLKVMRALGTADFNFSVHRKD